MTILEEYQNFIRQLENGSLELEKHISEEREQGIERINQNLDNAHILRFENGEYKIQTYLRKKSHGGNYSFIDGRYYYTIPNKKKIKLKLISKYFCYGDTIRYNEIADDINDLKEKIEAIEKQKSIFSNLAKIAKCGGIKIIDVRQFFIDLYQLNIKISNELKLYLFGKFIAQNCNLLKENAENKQKRDFLLEEKQIEAYFALGNYFDKKGNLTLYGPIFNKNGESNEKANLGMFENCFEQNVSSIIFDEQSSKHEDTIKLAIPGCFRNAIYYESKAQYSTLLKNEVANIRKNSIQSKVTKSERQSRKTIYQKEQEAITELATYWNGTELIKSCEDLAHFNDLLILANVSEEQRCVMISKMERFIHEERKYKHLTEEQKKTYLAAKKDKNNPLISMKVAEIDAALELLDDEEDMGIKQELNEHIISLKNILGI